MTPPPMKPSTVFLGLRTMRGVDPKKNPHMYAAMSLMVMMDMEKMYQTMPCWRVRLRRCPAPTMKRVAR